MNLVPGKQLKDRRRAVGGLATLLMVAATPVVAQQTTVIGGDGPESGVTVNLGALDGGSATPRRRSAAPRGEKLKLTPPKRTRQQQPETGSETGFASQRVEAGELVRGPLGILLRFPPLDEPRSQLTVDPDKLARKLDRQQQTAATQGQGDAPELRRPSPKPDTGKTGRAAETQTARQPESGTARQSSGAARSSGAPQSSDVQQSSDATEPTMPSAPSNVTAPQPVTPQVTKPAAPEAALDGAGTDTSAGAETQSSQSSEGTSGADTPEANAAQAGPSKTKTEPRTEPDAMASSNTGGAADRSAQQPSESASTESGEPRGTDEAQTQDRTGETQTAKRTPATGNLPDGVRLNFEAASAALPESGRQKLTRLAETLNANPERRVQLMAFAQGGDDGASRARRLSLSRALAVRSFLIDQGIRSTRMDVRALGDTAEGGPLNRVDIVPANR